MICRHTSQSPCFQQCLTNVNCSTAQTKLTENKDRHVSRLPKVQMLLVLVKGRTLCTFGSPKNENVVVIHVLSSILISKLSRLELVKKFRK